jgi:hypothetical protein
LSFRSRLLVDIEFISARGIEKQSGINSRSHP